MFLDTRLNFQKHLNNVLGKVKKTLRLLLKHQAFSQRQSLVTVYKTFIRPHLCYRDITYDQSYNDSFYQEMESVQQNAALAISNLL